MTQALPRIFVNSLPKAGTNLVARAFDLAGVSYDRLGIAGTLVLGNRYLLRQLLRRSFFEVDRRHVVLAVLVALARAGAIEREVAAGAVAKLEIDPDSQDPWLR